MSISPLRDCKFSSIKQAALIFTLNYFTIKTRDKGTDKVIYMYIIYSLTPIIQVNCDSVPSGYAENPDKLDFFSFKIGHIGSLKWKNILQTVILGYIFIYVQIKH